ncbi:hypothetical protein EV363DRAFT_1302928, partial [Boletus edulis]
CIPVGKIVKVELNITRAAARMDSQAKYGCLARGDGGVYLRMPTLGTGSLLVKECGGVITDSRGKFGLGQNLEEKAYGFIAAGMEVMVLTLTQFWGLRRHRVLP